MRAGARGRGFRRSVVVLLLGMAANAAPAGAQAVDTAVAVGALKRFAAECDAQGRAVWRHSLCGPVVLVHAPSRAAISNVRDPDGTFERRGGFWFGKLPAGLPTANTALQWGDVKWTMVLLPLPADEFAHLALIAHEAFHRIQPELGLAARDAQNPHLDEEQGRVWLRLELRALAAALRSDAGMNAIHDALAFRSHRYALFPGADTLEALLERHEGLAEYAGVVFAQAVTRSGLDPVLHGLERFERRRSYVRSLGYGTGPALGLLLDRHAPGWRTRAGTRPLHELLAEATGFSGPVGNVRERAQRYGMNDVIAEEAVRAAESAARLADIRSRLVDGPVLMLTQTDLQASFNPNELVPVPGAGTYYPSGTFHAAWGSLVVRQGGALVSPDWQRLQVSLAGPPAAGPIVEGDGWTLQLATGWTIEPHAGSWRVAPAR